MPTKHAKVIQVQGITFAGMADSTHWITIDGPPEFGGQNAGPRPKELVLIALGGCTGSDVVSILKKKRVAFDRLDINLTAELREEHPQIYKSIHVEYIIRGSDINQSDVERAIELSSTKYCAVSAMLKGNVEITHSFRIVAPES